MLTGEIKLYEEPAKWNSYPVQKLYKNMTPTEQAQFEFRVEKCIEDAKKLFGIGDTCKIKAGNREMEITGWIDDPEDVMYYQGDLCVIYARDALYPAAQSIRYSLMEFIPETAKKKYVPAEETPLVLLPNINE